MTQAAGAVGRSETGVDLPRAIVADLSRLDMLGSGLGAAACAYVRAGERTSVPLLIRQAAEAHKGYYWAGSQPETKERRRMIAVGELADQGLFGRYLEVLDAAEHGSTAAPEARRSRPSFAPMAPNCSWALRWSPTRRDRPDAPFGWTRW